ncbi:CYTH domain-containing protein [Candidatus Saccharibacteria bacterium]|nr:CYTH domain-containing protein [Candidatus Saccharibacteria bacterium]
MNTEIEATFLEIDHDKIRRKLKDLNAKLISPEVLTRRTIYDYDDLRLDKKAAWIRIRDNGEKITMGFKQRQTETIEGMKEVEFEVSSYDAARKFMESIGLTVKAVQESKREIWQYGDCEIMLDTWPWIPPYVEVEGPSEEAVKDCSKDLGLNWNQAMFDSTDAIYMKYYNVTRTEISTIPIKFGDLPKSMRAKEIS